MNKKIGHFLKNGMILFTHDYSQYHATSGFNRIGDMLDVGDFACLNATVFSQEFFKTNIPALYKDKSFTDFAFYFRGPQYQRIIVKSYDEASEYLKRNQIDPRTTDIVYLSPDYQVLKIDSLE